MQFQNLPKVELHLHLDGCLSYELVKSLRPDLSHEEYRDEFIAPARCRDLSDFLDHTRAGLALLQTERALKMTVADLCDQLESDGVRYAEMRFAPLLHTECGLRAERVAEIVNGTLEREIEGRPLDARLIFCTLRSFSEFQGMKTVRLVRRFRDSLVAGFDIAGYEANFPVDKHRSAFDYAWEHEINCTAHAGEAFGAKSVEQSLDQFHLKRIGHGVRAIENPILIRRLKQENIHLEVCPTSNVQVNVFENYESHPVDQLYRQGISLSINTDNRTLSDISLSEEYKKLHEAFGWEREDFLKINLNAIEAAFIPESLKNSLTGLFKEAYR